MRVAVVSYDAADGASLADRLRREGFDAQPYQHLGSKGFRELRARPPDAIVIDLLRMPSYGRAMGALLRESKTLRTIPLVFLEGDPEKTARVRKLLPDAAFATLPRIPPALRRVARTAPADPIVPKSDLNVAQKLRIGDSVHLIDAPEAFANLLPGVEVSPAGEVVLLFARSAAALSRGLHRYAGRPKLWVLWPKRASRVRTDVAFPRVKDECAALGLVAYKTCSVDDTWSAAAVARRRSQR